MSKAERTYADDKKVIELLFAEIIFVITSYSIHYTKLYEADKSGGC